MSYTLYFTDIMWKNNGIDMNHTGNEPNEMSIGGYETIDDIGFDFEINDYMDNSDIKDDIIISCSYRIETIEFENNTITEVITEEGIVKLNEFNVYVNYPTDMADDIDNRKVKTYTSK